MRILNIVDRYEWVYHRIAEDTGDYYPDDWSISILDTNDVKNWKDDLAVYDVIFMWAWIDEEGIHTDAVPHRLHDKTVFMVTTETAQKQVVEAKLPDTVKYIGVTGEREAVADKHAVTVFTLELGVDLKKFPQLPLPPEFTVGWAGLRVERHKRWPWADQARLQAGVPIIHATGSTVSLNGFYRDISVLLITSEREELTPYYYEALASGRPVISTLVGDIPKTARDGENGVYLPTYGVDSPDFAEIITMLKNDEKVLQSMSVEALKSVEPRSWEHKIEAYVDAVKEVGSLPVPEPEPETLLVIEVMSDDEENVDKALAEAKPKPRRKRKTTTR